MTLHKSLLHTLLQMWCWSWYGVKNCSVVLKSMQRTINMHVLTFTAVSASETQFNINKRMVGRKLEISPRSGSKYLTLAGKSWFWYQIALGALRLGFMSILVLQSSWWGRESELAALLSLSSWCLVMVVWLFLAVPWVCLRFVIVVFSDHTHYFWQNLALDLDPNCSSLYPVSTYYIRNQATGVSLAGR